MEYLDVVNDQDMVVGKASQKEVYEKLLRHRIVHIMVLNDKGEILLQKRSAKKAYMPLHWVTSAGGHVQSGETYEQAARRELKEELGIQPLLELKYKDSYIIGEAGISKFLTTFHTSSSQEMVLEPEEVDSVEYFPLSIVENMIDKGEKFHPELLFLLKKYYLL
jgi:isopentenyl-diphosphate delta-isomerase